MGEGNEVDLFLSHTSTDKAFVDRLHDALVERGLTTWYDKQDITVGDSITGSVNQGIRRERYMIAVLSEAAARSRWVQEELNAALMRDIASTGTFLLPVLIEDCDLPPLLAHRAYADFRTSFDNGLSAIVTAVREDDEIRSRLDGAKVAPPPGNPDGLASHLYVLSKRWDKCFKVSVDFGGTVGDALTVIRGALKLPFRYDEPDLGYRWSYTYSLRVDGAGTTLASPLVEVCAPGSLVTIAIRARRRDLLAGQMEEIGERIYTMTPEMMQEQVRLSQRVSDPKRRSPESLRVSANRAFAHLSE